LPITDEILHYETRLAREPTSQAYAALGEAYRRVGRTEDAVRLCREGLGRFPGYSTARLVLAKALLDGGDLVEARREIEQFVGEEPDHEPALRIAVECALRLGDPRGALRHLRRLLVLDSQDRGIQGLLRALDVAAGGRVAVEEGLWPLLRDDTFATVTFGDLCVAQGLLDEATAVFSRILLREPDHETARARLADLGRPRGPARRPRG
jgi:tetratricopeptide (TPR) repeat protein